MSTSSAEIHLHTLVPRFVVLLSYKTNNINIVALERVSRDQLFLISEPDLKYILRLTYLR